MDRLALPNDRREACRACGSEKREYLTTCAACGTDICSSCSEFISDGEFEVCDLCASTFRNNKATYGHQFELGVS